MSRSEVFSAAAANDMLLKPEMNRLIEEAAQRLWNNELVAFPTETVYGVGAHAARAEAVLKIFAAKGRPADHPLIVHLPAANRLSQWAVDIPEAAWELAERFWPGPMTLILKKQPWVPLEVTGGQDTVGLRVPNHPIALKLLEVFADGGRPGRGGIAAPSANRFGHVSPTTAADVMEELGQQVSLILDGGACAVGIESTIIDLSREKPEILRPGIVSPERLADILGIAPGYGHFHPANAAPRVSGSLASHYAPRTPARLLPRAELHAYLATHPEEHCGVLAYTLPTEMHPAHIWHMLSPTPEAYAHALYAALRTLDRRRTAQILIETPPETPEWTAIRDRIGRATAKRTAIR